jgi:PliI/PliC-like inhibitor of I-type lysozyme
MPILGIFIGEFKPLGDVGTRNRYYCLRVENMKQFLVTAVIVLLSTPFYAAAQDRFIIKLTLPTGQTVVVAEGDFEARSIGSFSVRLYEAAPTSDETTFFTSGLIHFRDGVLEKVLLADIDGDHQPEIVVIVRSVGTGDYLSAHAFLFTKDKLFFCAVVEGLPPDTDPITALLKSKTEGRWDCER